MDELEFYNGQLTGQEIDYRIIYVSCGTISSLPTTVENAKITSKHIVLRAYFGSPYAQISDWTVTTADGSLTIAGTITGSTSLYLALGIPG